MRRYRAPRSPRSLKEGLNAEQAFVGNQNGDAKAAIASAAKKVEAVYSYPYQNHAPMEPMNATARYTAGQVRGVGPDAGRRGFVRGNARRVRPAGRQVRGAPDRPRRRLRPARRVPGLRASGCPHRQGDAGHPDQAALVARGRHGAGPVSPGHDGQDGRRARQGQQPDRPAHPPVGAVDPRERASAGAWSRRRGAIRSPSRVCSSRASIRSATRSRTC